MESCRLAHQPLTRRGTLTLIGSIVGFAGCLGSETSNGPSGTITGSGSNTVAPITDIAGEDYMNVYSGVTVDIRPEGTGAGFQEFCRGNSHVQSASRVPLDREINLCAEHDVSYSRFTVARDAVAVGVHRNNDWVDHLTLDELRTIWAFESPTEKWSDIRSDWPDEQIRLYGRDSGSGTFDYFTREITGTVGDIRDNYSATSQTHEIWTAVDQTEYALGWGAVGHLRGVQSRGGTLRSVAIESDEQPGEFFQPTRDHIENGDYSPLSRPLFIYINHAALGEDPDLLGSYLRWYFNHQQSLAREVDFFATSSETVRENHNTLDGILRELDVDPSKLSVQRDISSEGDNS